MFNGFLGMRMRASITQTKMPWGMGLGLRQNRLVAMPRQMFHVEAKKPTLDEKPVKMFFTYSKTKSDLIEVLAREGDSLLDVAHYNGIDLEGACESSLACSTCHVILQDDVYDSLEEPVEEEEDLLDLAYGLTHTSRLGCQVKVTRDMQEMVVRLPSATRNFYVDKSKLNIPDN